MVKLLDYKMISIFLKHSIFNFQLIDIAATAPKNKICRQLPETIYIYISKVSKVGNHSRG